MAGLRSWVYRMTIPIQLADCPMAIPQAWPDTTDMAWFFVAGFSARQVCSKHPSDDHEGVQVAAISS